MIKKPKDTEYPPFYKTYTSLIHTDDILTLLGTQGEAFCAFVKDLDPSQADHRYAEGKWSIREVVGHIIEVERIMAYRALAISRGDQQSLPGMDENLYIEKSNYKNISLADLAEEFDHVRQGNIYLFNSFSEEMVERKGVANNSEITVAALVYIIAGHLRHHVRILKERYLNIDSENSL